MEVTDGINIDTAITIKIGDTAVVPLAHALSRWAGERQAEGVPVQEIALGGDLAMHMAQWMVDYNKGGNSPREMDRGFIVTGGE